jgi:hypothetical protein
MTTAPVRIDPFAHYDPAALADAGRRAALADAARLRGDPPEPPPTGPRAREFRTDNPRLAVSMAAAWCEHASRSTACGCITCGRDKLSKTTMDCFACKAAEMGYQSPTPEDIA